MIVCAIAVFCSNALWRRSRQEAPARGALPHRNRLPVAALLPNPFLADGPTISHTMALRRVLATFGCGDCGRLGLGADVLLSQQVGPCREWVRCHEQDRTLLCCPRASGMNALCTP